MIEKYPKYQGLEPQPPARGRARELGQDSCRQSCVCCHQNHFRRLQYSSAAEATLLADFARRHRLGVNPRVRTADQGRDKPQAMRRGEPHGHKVMARPPDPGQQWFASAPAPDSPPGRLGSEVPFEIPMRRDCGRGRGRTASCELRRATPPQRRLPFAGGPGLACSASRRWFHETAAEQQLTHWPCPRL